MEPAEELKRGADRIASLILYSDLPWVDIAIEIEKLRERCMEIDPEHLDLFENLYESRFHRLWEQWREEGQMRRYRRI
jgi:hypothetical protein